ncbi:SpaH/EbpB family LPXTG-anchored major pilin [Lachnospiraceae bacterium C1.1]|nr:SpaH/EbpB family LPXTG-anchored major pilin [Lachnospiraceae bacterium C1.1]
MKQLTRLKKIAASLLTAALVFTSVVGVAADTTDSSSSSTGTGTITISNAVSKNTVSYNLYRIFDFEGSTSSNGVYTEGVYKLSSKWSGFESKYFKENSDKTLTFNNLTESTVKAFAKEAFAYVSANSITVSADYTRKNAKEKSNSDGTVTLTFSGVPLGYYLIDSSVGTLLSLDTTSSNATMTEKNEEPTVEKEVYDISDYADTNHAAIGDVVKFQATINCKVGAENYVFHDNMSEGLSFNGVNSMTAVMYKADGTLIREVDHDKLAKAIDTDPKDGDTFDLTVGQEYLDEITKDGYDGYILLTYSATVTSDALIAADANTNNAKLTYGDDQTTEWDQTKTYVYQFELKKYSASDSTSANLAGAKFSLLSENKVSMNLIKIDDTTYRLATAAEVEAGKSVTEFETVAAGNTTVSGLNAAKYYLRETEAPSGYNRLTEDVEVVISRQDSSAVEKTYLVNSSSDRVVAIANGTGSVLPSTGGIGTTIFYIVGGILIIAGLAWFIVRRKSDAE